MFESVSLNLGEINTSLEQDLLIQVSPSTLNKGRDKV